MRRAVALLAFVASVGAVEVARADEASEAARAEALFDEGNRLLDEHRYAEACEKLAESRKIAPGIGVSLYLADCNENLGRTATALALFREAEKMALMRRDRREQIAHDRAEKLESKAPSLVVRIPIEVPGLVVTIDGADHPRSAWLKSVRLDPGPHAVVASAPKHAAFSAQVSLLATGDTVTVDVPKLAAKAEAKPVKSEGFTTQQWIGVGAAGVGVLAIGVGVVFGVVAKGKLDDSKADGHCSADNRCDATGLSLRSDADTAATVANISVAFGALAAAGGAVLFFWPQRNGRAAMQVGPSVAQSGAGLRLSGAF